MSVLIFVYTRVKWVAWCLAVWAHVVLTSTLAHAQNSELDAALARVKITDLSARPCDPKAVWRFDITDPEVLNSWRAFLDATNPIIRNILYSGCDGISSLVADIQFMGRRIAVAQLATNYDEPPSRIIRDPVILQKFEAIYLAERKAADKADRAAFEEKMRIVDEKARVASIEGDRIRAEAAQKKELELSQAMKPDGSGLAPYHVQECHYSAGTPRGTSALTERDICEAIFRAGLSKPAVMVFPDKPVCDVIQKKGAIPLARCRYDYEIVHDHSKRDRSDLTAEAALSFMSKFGMRLPGTTLPSSYRIAADSREFEMPKYFYFDILKKQWEPNGAELKRIYEVRTRKKQDEDRAAYRRVEKEDAFRLCEQTERTRSNLDDCNAKVIEQFKPR